MALVWTVPLFVLPIVANEIWTLFAGISILGVFGGAFVVAINTHAAEVEAARGRPTMSSFHGFWSLGGLAAAVVGGVLYWAGLEQGQGAAGVAVVLLAGSIWAIGQILPARISTPNEVESGGKGGGIALASGALLLLAVSAFFGNSVEGAVGDWSALFLSTVKGSDATLAGSGYAMFSLAMALFRFGGGPVAERVGEKALVVGGGLCVSVGMLVALLAPWPLVSALGFLLIGLGAANVGPILMGAAARLPDVSPSVGVATVSVAQAGGILASPPMIGFVAQAFGLGPALWLIVAAGLIVTFGALIHRWQPTGSGA